MGTEILRPQDCLIESIRVRPASFSRRKSYYHGNPIANQNYVSNPRSRKPAVRSESRRIQVQAQPADAAPVAKRSSSHDDLRGFKMEKVTILRRGESLDSKMNEKGGLAGTGTARLRPGPEMVQKQVRIVDLRSPVGGKTDMYAGAELAPVAVVFEEEAGVEGGRRRLSDSRPEAVAPARLKMENPDPRTPRRGP